jgi:hypothetical protein
VIQLFKKAKGKKQLQDVIHSLVEKVSHLEQGIQELAKKPSEYNIHIDHIDVHNPGLENLTFRMDSLDIEELSGALNLGNNFGVSPKDSKNIIKKNKEKKQGTDRMKNPNELKNQQTGEFTMKQSRSGFSVSMNNQQREG